MTRRNSSLILIVLAIAAVTVALLLLSAKSGDGRPPASASTLRNENVHVKFDQGVHAGGSSRQLLLGVDVNTNGYADPRTTALKVETNDAATKLEGSDTSLMTRAWSASPFQCHGPFPLKTHGTGMQHVVQQGDVAYSKTVGMLFVKPMKTGSSTASGVQMQIAKNMAKRRAPRLNVDIDALIASDGDNRKVSDHDHEQLYCQSSFGHRSGEHFRRRDPNGSFLWTLLREPTKRATSHFFYETMKQATSAKKQKEYKDDDFKRFLEGGAKISNPINYYLAHHTTNQQILRKLDASILDMSRRGKGVRSVKRNLEPALAFDDYRNIGNNIMSEYNFMAITERFDESMVVMAMLLNVPLGDVLYLPSKSNGHLNDCDGSGTCKCIELQHPFVTPEMDMYLSDTDPESILQKEGYPYTWEERVRWDKAMYEAANISLDRTIDEVLGRDVFAQQLDLFKRALALVNERCAEGAQTTCSPEGDVIFPAVRLKCLWRDWACGYDCVEQVAVELNLH